MKEEFGKSYRRGSKEPLGRAGEETKKKRKDEEAGGELSTKQAEVPAPDGFQEEAVEMDPSSWEWTNMANKLDRRPCAGREQDVPAQEVQRLSCVEERRL